MHFFFLSTSNDILQKNILAQDRLDGWENIKEIVLYQSQSYIPEIIWTELTSKHYNWGILALKKLDDLLPENDILQILSLLTHC